MGTLYLLIPRRTDHIIMGILVAISIYATFRVVSAPIDLSALNSLSATGAPKVMPIDVRLLLTMLPNIFGTAALVGGALYSAFVFWRRRFMPHQVISNILVALGAILLAVGGTSMRLGTSQYFSSIHLLGIIIIFIGFLRSR